MRRDRWNRWAGVALCCVTALGMSACGGSGGDSGGGGSDGGDSSPIKIGVINPFSGDFAVYGEEVTRGYELAVQEANDAGGVNGRQVELLRGDATTADQAIDAANRLGTRENVDAFIGTYISAAASAASDVAARQGKLYWETNGVADDLTERGLENYLRFGFRATDFANVSVEGLAAIAEALGKPVTQLRVYIEHEDSIYGSSVAKQQQVDLKKQGIPIVGVGKHAAAATDLTDSVMKAKNAKPDVLLSTGYVPDTNLLLRTARSQGFHPPATLLVGTGDTNDTLESIGAKNLAGTLVTAYPGADVSEAYAPGADKFLAAYKAKYKSDPRAPQSLTAYAGAQSLLKMIGEAKGTAVEDVRKVAMAADVPFNSLPNGFGIKFDEKGQNQLARPVIVQWRGDGKKVTVFPAEAAGDNAIEGLGGH